MADLPEGTQLVYVNWVRAQSTPFDLGLDFGYNDAPGPPDSYPVRVVMSWEHAKAFIQLLENGLKSYEEQAGPVRDMVEGVEESDDNN